MSESKTLKELKRAILECDDHFAKEIMGVK